VEPWPSFDLQLVNGEFVRIYDKEVLLIAKTSDSAEWPDDPDGDFMLEWPDLGIER